MYTFSMDNHTYYQIARAEAFAIGVVAELEKRAEFDWSQFKPWMPYLGAGLAGLAGYSFAPRGNQLLGGLGGALLGGLGGYLGGQYAAHGQDPWSALKGLGQSASEGLSNWWNQSGEMNKDLATANRNLQEREIHQGTTPQELGLRDNATGQAPVYTPGQKVEVGGRAYTHHDGRLYQNPPAGYYPQPQGPMPKVTEGVFPKNSAWWEGFHEALALLEKQAMKMPGNQLNYHRPKPPQFNAAQTKFSPPSGPVFNAAQGAQLPGPQINQEALGLGDRSQFQQPGIAMPGQQQMSQQGQTPISPSTASPTPAPQVPLPYGPQNTQPAQQQTGTPYGTF